MKRPFAATTLLFMVLCLTAWNSIRLYAALSDWDALAEFAPRPGPLYISITASFWTFGGFALARLILRPSPRARLFAALYFFGYAAWYWADRLLLQAPHSNWPFALAATLLLLAIVCLAVLNRNARNYLGL